MGYRKYYIPCSSRKGYTPLIWSTEMTKKYTPATFQPTVRPSWCGILSYISEKEKSDILEAIIKYPNDTGLDSRFWLETIKPDLDEQYQKFINTCEQRGRGAKTYWGEHKLSLSNTYDEHKDNLLKDKDKDKVKVKDKVKNNRPTLQDVIDYCQERSNGVDANKWYDYYTANGWKVGRNPMKDWKATVRTWEKHQEQKQEPTKNPNGWTDEQMQLFMKGY